MNLRFLVRGGSSDSGNFKVGRALARRMACMVGVNTCTNSCPSFDSIRIRYSRTLAPVAVDAAAKNYKVNKHDRPLDLNIWSYWTAAIVQSH